MDNTELFEMAAVCVIAAVILIALLIWKAP